jgi:hypothetical protein
MSGLALRTHFELQDHPSEHSFGCESCVLTAARYSPLIRATCVCVAAIGNGRLIAVLKRDAD